MVLPKFLKGRKGQKLANIFRGISQKYVTNAAAMLSPSSELPL